MMKSIKSYIDVQGGSFIERPNEFEVSFKNTPTFVYPINIDLADFMMAHWCNASRIEHADLCSSCTVRDMKMVYCFRCSKPKCIDCIVKSMPMYGIWCSMCPHPTGFLRSQSAVNRYVPQVTNHYWENKLW